MKERVKQDWIDEKRREFRDDYVNQILSNYDVVFDEMPPEEAPDEPEDLSGGAGAEAPE